ncbi:MAG: hypothetical protein V7L11_31465 [Nostoc sp.]|uniref:hypothetical protein n=1 Tax=Nostoc sp. TaxID=1180 RepID=UPI002FF92992
MTKSTFLNYLYSLHLFAILSPPLSYIRMGTGDWGLGTGDWVLGIGQTMTNDY